MFFCSYSSSRLLLPWSLLLLLLQTTVTSAKLHHHWGASDKFTVTNGDDRDALGVEVRVYGNTIAVGADGDDDRGSAAGAVYMYRKDGRHFALEDKLLALTGAQNDAFGSTFSLREDIIAIGAPRNGEDGKAQRGAVYIFRYDGDGDWQETQELNAADSAEADFFGTSVEFFNDETLLIGAPGVGNSTGKFYVYRENLAGDFEFVVAYAPENPSDGQLFGNYIAANGEFAVIGSSEDDNVDEVKSGSAYIYRSNTADDNGVPFAFELKLVPDDGLPNDEFGYRVAISNSTIAVGAPNDDDNFIQTDAGSVYMYEYNGTSWEFDQKITRSTVINRLSERGAKDHFFGSSLSLDGDYLVVGAPAANTLVSQNAGTAYIYRRRDGRKARNHGTWGFEDSVTACEASESDNFGYSVSLDMSTETLVVGSLAGGGTLANPGLNPGAAFVYRRTGFRFINQFLCRFFY
jgi:hypothetical protein